MQELKQLVSYDDLNFYFRVKKEVDNPNIADINQDGYVFKVINSSQSTCCGIVGRYKHLHYWYIVDMFDWPFPLSNLLRSVH